MEPAALAASFNLASLGRAFLDDPYPTYRALREHDPVHRMADGSYFLTRYDDLVEVYRDAKTWSSDKKLQFRPNFGDSLLYEHHTTSLVFNDPPIHTRVRKLLAPSFTPRTLRAMQPRIEALVDHLLDATREHGTMDLIEDFAAAIPVQLIGDLLGIPRNERGPLRNWSLKILGALEPVLSKEQFDDGVNAVSDFKDYLRDLVARRHKEGAQDSGEILSTLIDASEVAGTGGDRLSELELLHNCIFLLNAGHETTTNLIGNSVDLLIRNPDAWRDLAAHPETIETAVEEFLRMESSNQLGNRRAAIETRIGGVTMPPGTYVHLCIGAANRDPAQFPEPDRCDIRRHPNRHLAFGFGIHTCAGNSLARMEAQVAIGKLIRRFKSIGRAGEPVRGGRARFRGFARYPVAVSTH
ncbi:MAG: cytochrome P450 [Reyranella sp.]